MTSHHQMNDRSTTMTSHDGERDEMFGFAPEILSAGTAVRLVDANDTPDTDAGRS